MIRSRLRIAIRNHVVSYIPYLRMMGFYDPDQLPSPQTDVHIAGYPRSANSFCTILLQRYAPSLRIAHHVHTPVTLKLARKHGVKTIVLIRDPAEAISSNIVRMGEGKGETRYQIDNCIGDYVSYYEFVRAHREDFVLLDFSSATGDPANLFRAAADLGVIEMPDDDTVRATAEQSLQQLRADGRKPEMRNLPNKKKNARKAEVKAMIEADPGYQRALALYRELSPIR
jgi:hypothetical protein